MDWLSALISDMVLNICLNIIIYADKFTFIGLVSLVMLVHLKNKLFCNLISN